MGRGALNMRAITYTFILLTLTFAGCQSNLEKIGQDHATEVIKWQKLAEYAGNELKPLGLTITAGVQIHHEEDNLSFSIVNVQLNRSSNHTEIDLLSPKFAEKFACNNECQNLGLYDSNFVTPKTQLANFFFIEEGRFFEFYGKLTRLNELLAFYRASSPEILNKYLTLMLNRKMKFNSLSAFMQYLESHITEDNLLAFSQSGFVSPVKDRLSSSFVKDLMVNIPIDVKDKNATPSGLSVVDENWTAADSNWTKNDDESTQPDSHWALSGDDANMPNNDWVLSDDDINMPNKDWFSSDNELNRPDNNWITTAQTPDELLSLTNFNASANKLVIDANWQRAKLHNIQVGAIVCSFSDNSLGLVKEINADHVTLDLIAQARLLIDGMNLYPQAGYLFSAVKSYYFVKSETKASYPLSDIAACDLTQLTQAT